MSYPIASISPTSGTTKRRSGTTSLALIMASIGALGATVAEASPPTCDLHLSLELTPDVPTPREAGFLSSLLGNHPGYRLLLQREIDDTHLELELYGPGPGYRCEKVLETMRKDGRVLSVTPDDSDVVVAAVGDSPSPATQDIHFSRAGLGSLAWVAHRPTDSWRIVAPIQADDGSQVSADIREQCAAEATGGAIRRRRCP
jgi:hypothetical protein